MLHICEGALSLSLSRMYLYMLVVSANSGKTTRGKQREASQDVI